MITIAIRVREIISSNVDSLVSTAGEPRKMLRLLQSEIEESLIALHGDAAKARRQQARMSEAAARLAEGAESWTDKAKVALDHGREDLARAALLAREAERAKAVDAAKAAAALDEEIAALQKASAIDAELAALKAAAPAPAKKSAGKKRG